jgi:hypothetical protein
MLAIIPCLPCACPSASWRSGIASTVNELLPSLQVVNSAVVSEVGSKKVTECLVGDATGTILFKARGNEAEEMTTGRSLRIRGCKVDMHHGSMRLVCGADAVIEDISAVAAKVWHLHDIPQRMLMNFLTKLTLLNRFPGMESPKMPCQGDCKCILSIVSHHANRSATIWFVRVCRLCERLVRIWISGMALGIRHDVSVVHRQLQRRDQS